MPNTAAVLSMAMMTLESIFLDFIVKSLAGDFQSLSHLAEVAFALVYGSGYEVAFH